MATSNFSRPNASKIYACLMGNDIGEYDYDFLIDDVYEAVVEKLSDHTVHDSQATYNNVREIFTVTFCKMFGDIEGSVTITGTIQSGYYAGAQLDYTIDEDFNPYGSDLNQGMRTIQERNFDKWKEKTIKEKTLLIEQVYEQFSTPMVAVATFSNGETIYETIN